MEMKCIEAGNASVEKLSFSQRGHAGFLSLFQYEDEPEGRELEGVVGGVGK